jgi:hypothetical protein
VRCRSSRLANPIALLSRVGESKSADGLHGINLLVGSQMVVIISMVIQVMLYGELLKISDYTCEIMHDYAFIIKLFTTP